MDLNEFLRGMFDQDFPAQFKVGDSVTVTGAEFNPSPGATLEGDLDGAVGTVVSDEGLILEYGARGYLVELEDVRWDHPDAPAELPRNQFALLEAEISAA